MKRIWNCLFVLLSVNCFGQNLVPNPSFEDTVACPYFASQIDKALGWHASSWTPDYFNECNWLNGNTSIPGNFRGYQYAQDGVAYSGIGTYASNTSNFTEAFTCQLNTPLTIGQKYIVSFYTSKGDLFYRLSANKLGVLFSTINFDTASPPPMNNYCQFFSDSIITDTLNWILVQGSFIADSSYTFMTIGRFFDDLHTDTICNPPFYPFTYYYIDNISVIEDTTTSILDLNTTSKLIVYPNPCKHVLSIKKKGTLVSKIELMDYLGKYHEMHVERIESEKIILNTSNLKNGIYLIKFYLSDNTQFISKFIKL